MNPAIVRLLLQVRDILQLYAIAILALFLFSRKIPEKSRSFYLVLALIVIALTGYATYESYLRLNGSYFVVVTVINADGMVDNKVQISSSINGISKITNSGVEFEIPMSAVSNNQCMKIYAHKEEDYSNGESSICFGKNKHLYVNVELTLKKVSIYGTIENENGYLIKYVDIYCDGRRFTSTNGSFIFPEGFYVGKSYEFRLEKKGYKSVIVKRSISNDSIRFKMCKLKTLSACGNNQT